MDWKPVFSSICVLCLLGLTVPVPSEGGFLRMADLGGDGGPFINLVVRQVKMTPVRAHVGDPIRIEMAIEHQGEATGTVLAEVRANGKVVAETRFTYGFGEEPGYIYRKSFLWDTKGVPPGEYRIRGDVFLWYDSSESDNYLDLKEPLVLLSPGQPFSEGAEAGGTAVAVDPRWTPPSHRKSSVPPGGY